VLPLASFYSEYTTVAGALAASVAVMGFIFQAVLVLRKHDEMQVRRLAAIGGITGLIAGLAGLVLSATFQ
jgi:hypothetical protein